MFNGRDKFKKIIIAFFALFFVANSFYFLAFGQAQPVRAQVPPEVPVVDISQNLLTLGGNAHQVMYESLTQIWDDLKATFFKNVVSTLARQAAKGTAQWIVTGGKGAKPFWETDIWGSIVDKSKAAAEDYVTGVIQAGTGLNICSFDPKLTMNIALLMPENPDGITPANLLGQPLPPGCSFQSLIDKFPKNSQGWTDYVKITATTLGPTFKTTVNKIQTDISNSPTLAHFDDATSFLYKGSDSLKVQADLTKWADMLSKLNDSLTADIGTLNDNKGTTNQPFTSPQPGSTIGTNGTYYAVPEDVAKFKSDWDQLIRKNGRDKIFSETNILNNCSTQTVAAFMHSPCSQVLSDLGYDTSQITPEFLSNPKNAATLVTEVQRKVQNANTLYNELKSGYDSLINYVDSQIRPEMFQGPGPYSFGAAKDFSSEQANPASTTAAQLASNTQKAAEQASAKQSTLMQVNQGWNSITGKITDLVQTPARLLQQKSIESLGQDATPLQYTKSIIADSLGVFLSELYNLYIQKLLASLYNPKEQKTKSRANIFSTTEQSMVTETGVALYFASFEPGTNNEFPELDLLTEFQLSLKGQKANPNIYNNVIDSDFAQAIQNRMTIADALTAGKLKPDAKFYTGSDLQDNTYNLSNIEKLRKARVVPVGLEMAAQLEGDCNFRATYNPCVGMTFVVCNQQNHNICNWEPASNSCQTPKDINNNNLPKFSLANFDDLNLAPADLSNGLINAYAKQRLSNCRFDPKDASGNFTAADVAKNKAMYSQALNATLGQVVNDFDKRGQDGICGTADAGESPFCNLVDPQWVLKIPQTKCYLPQDAATAKVTSYGELLQNDDSGTRYSRCADFVSCVKDDQVKSCGSANYQICVKEKNVWRFDAKACPDYYNSCRLYSYQQADGKSTNVAYLKNTLDPDGCSADTVNCKAYTRQTDNKVYYFNRNKQTCSADNNGCHEFITDQDTINNYPADCATKTTQADCTTNSLCQWNGSSCNLPTQYDPSVLASRVYYKTNSACEADPTGADCGKFMPRCLDSEVGCANYTPLNGDSSVSAVIQPDDQCPAECNGYSAYFRQPTAFEPTSEINYFVPASATTCQAANAGCSQFTNLDVVAKGGEGIEYYTNLRQCIKPNTGLGEKTYFTWQNVSAGPAQIVKYALQADTSGTPATNSNYGAPKTFDDSGDCRLPGSTSDYCLKFYDSSGNTFYRDLNKTIIASDDCHPFRKTDSNEITCNLTNGTWDNNVCIYNAVPALSQTCPAAEVGCFNYSGASGNNIFQLFHDVKTADFTDNWQLADSASILHDYPVVDNGVPQGYSLKIAQNSSAARNLSGAGNLTGGNNYILYFTAKGAGNLSIPNFGTVILSDTWHSYSLGPIKLSSDLSQIVFDNQGSADLQITDIIVELHKDIYVIKDSWSSPNCGMADLNCQAYRGPQDNIFYLKSFSVPCSADKVGCQYLLDTQNSSNPQATTAQNITVAADNKVPYVVNDNFKCTFDNKGCEQFSTKTLGAGGLTTDTVYLKNDPDKYTGLQAILCDQSSENCVELTNANGAPEYYKIDPTKLCTYEHNHLIVNASSNINNSFNGWFIAGTDTGCNSVLTADNKPYVEANNCQVFGHGIWLSDKQQCAKILPVADQADQKTCQGDNGVWVLDINGQHDCVSDPLDIAKVADTGLYNNYSGVCEPAFGDCTGFKTINQDQSNGQVYTVFDNGNNLDRSSCSSGVDWNQGCVAFQNQVTNETETLKVTKDRDCGEWVICQKTDQKGNCLETQDLYYSADGSTQISKDINVKDPAAPTITATSTDPLKPNIKGDGVRYNSAGAPLIISRDNYAKRFASASAGVADNPFSRWDIGDYSGYTIPGRNPFEVEIDPNYQFTVYPIDSLSAGARGDVRYTAPVCKIFPEENSPLPYDITSLSKYSKIGSTYSQSVLLPEIGSGCNYDRAEVGGITTAFPFGYLSKKLGVTNKLPQVCTANKSLNGKLCTATSQCVTPLDPTNPTAGGNVSGTCSAIENLKTNLGYESRCLEMDYTNPLYGGIYKQGTYACLTYFPFKFNECALIKDAAKCATLPYCKFINGSCKYNVCKYHKDKTSCAADVQTDDLGNSISQCIWDAQTNACLDRICSLTKTSQTGCPGLATYCSWYNGRCTEDICKASFSKLLATKPLDSHGGAAGDTCMNTLSDYCTWSAISNPPKYRWAYSCNLKCGIKFPGSDATTKTNCSADGFCAWRDPACQESCQNYTDVDSCDPNSCAWDSDHNVCRDKCFGESTDISFDGSTITSQCTTNADCKLQDDYTCANACTGKKASECTTDIGCSASQEQGCSACTWDPTANAGAGECKETCSTITTAASGTPAAAQAACVAFTYTDADGVDVQACNWNGTSCVKKTTCSGATVSDQAGYNTCKSTFGCEISQPQCERKTDCISSSSSAACNLVSGCSWNSGSCVNKIDSSGCGIYKGFLVCSSDPNCVWYNGTCIGKEGMPGCQKYDATSSSDSTACIADKKCELNYYKNSAYYYCGPWNTPVGLAGDNESTHNWCVAGCGKPYIY